MLCPKDRMDSVIDRILSETSSLGVRYYDADRRTLAREHIFVHTPYGEIQVKRITEPGGSVRIVPEYEVCKKIALRAKKSNQCVGVDPQQGHHGPARAAGR